MTDIAYTDHNFLGNILVVGGQSTALNMPSCRILCLVCQMILNRVNNSVNGSLLFTQQGQMGLSFQGPKGDKVSASLLVRTTALSRIGFCLWTRLITGPRLRMVSQKRAARIHCAGLCGSDCRSSRLLIQFSARGVQAARSQTARSQTFLSQGPV